jgi:hypothetical protein
VTYNGIALTATTFAVKADGTGIEPTNSTAEFISLPNPAIGQVFTFVGEDGLTYTMTATQVA